MVSSKVAIIMVGAPGSGKGTQGELLEKNTGFKRYVMSSLFKDVVKKGSDLFDKMSSGILLSDLDVFDVFKKGFQFEDKVIIDGIPRSEDQAYWLYGFLIQHKYKIEVVYLKVDESKLLSRILKRAKDQGRSDDNEEVFKHRLEQFDFARDIILKIYSDNIIEVDGDRDINIIAKDVLNEVNKVF